MANSRPAFALKASNLYSPFGYDERVSSLRQRIERALQDETLRIQHEAFERCAISVLRSLYPNIESVSGGTDGGLDGRFVHDRKTIGILVTSSRTWKGSTANLRKNLKSVSEHYPEIESIVFASLADFSMKRRQQLEAIARDSGFNLLQAFGRDWFVDRFYDHPDWRKLILGIPDDPSALSRHPLGWAPSSTDHKTIGRATSFEQIASSEKDVVLVGLPGIGKTHVAACLPDAAFLNSHAAGAGLVDDLVQLHPSFVVVDDAGRKGHKIELLRLIRESEGFDFRIVATCWPHQRTDVAKELVQPEVIDIDRLSRAEIGEILRARGITRKVLIARILEQADGRPGWAINLANLVIEQKDWEAAWSGAGLLTAVESSIAKLGLDDKALSVLGTLALIGELDERDIPRFANLLEIPRLEIFGLLDSIATAGLADVSLQRSYVVITTAKHAMNLYSTQPGMMRTSLASTVFFSEKSQPVPIAAVKAAFPDHLRSILQSQCDAYHAKAPRVCIPTEEEVECWAIKNRSVNLLQSFAAIGPRQSEFCVEAVLRCVREHLQTSDTRSALQIAQDLGESVGAFRWSHGSTIINNLSEILYQLKLSDVDYESIINALSKSLHSTWPGEPPSAQKKINFLRYLIDASVSERLETIDIMIVARLATPTFDISYLDPESPSIIVMTTGAWEPETLQQLGKLFRQIVADRWLKLSAQSQCQLLELLREWVRIAFRGVTFELSAEQREVARTVASSVATTMCECIQDPGVRHRFNAVAEPLNLKLEEHDRLFAALCGEIDFRLGAEEAFQRRQNSIATALEPYLGDEPTVLMEWLKHHASSFEFAESRGGTHRLFWSLAEEDIDHAAWARAAKVAGFTRESKPIVAEAVKRDSLSTTDRNFLGDSDAGFQVLLEAVVDLSDNFAVIEECLSKATADNFAVMDHVAIWRSNAITREALFTHPDAGIRGLCAAIWSASPELDVQNEHWRNAISEYPFKESGRTASFHHEALKNILLADTELFADLFRASLSTSSDNDIIDFEPWSYAMESSTAEVKSQIWRHVDSTPQAPDAFWAVAGNDLSWAKSEISSPNFNQTANDLLQAYGRTIDLSYDLVDLAEVLRPLHPDIGELVYTIDFGMFTGPESKVLEKRLEMLRGLSESEDSYLSNIGERGIAFYEPRLIRAQKREREAEIRGRLA